MTAFWKALHGEHRKLLTGYLFFVGLAIGLLAKGPVPFVLTAIPIGAWVLAHNRWKETWRGLPWISGTLLMLAIALPWYLIAEQKTPGFLRYFIVGEHFERFLISGWKGDLYGSGHAEPRGSIWLFWLATLLPWTLLLFLPFFKRTRAIIRGFKTDKSHWSYYLLCWALAPLVFFTAATNIISTYVITGTPASCFLIIEVALFATSGQDHPSVWYSRLFKGSLVTGFGVFLTAYLVFTFMPQRAPKRTQKDLVAHKTIAEGPVSLPLYYLSRKQYSIEFYTEGKAIRLENQDQLTSLIEDSKPDFISIDERKFKALKPEIQGAFLQHGKFGKSLLISDQPSLNKKSIP
jgi:4-amino-4-deoxy-L-arabinose transferase-like glycosyltransferase